MPKISDLPAASTVNANDFVAVVDRSGVSVTKKATAAVVANSMLTLASGVKSDTAAVAGSTKIVNIVLVTQQQYDSIGTPDSQTLYVVREN